jgi:hypothetical protein
MKLGDNHARSNYCSLEIVYHAFGLDELTCDGVVVQQRVDWRSLAVKKPGRSWCGGNEAIQRSDCGTAVTGEIEQENKRQAVGEPAVSRQGDGRMVTSNIQRDKSGFRGVVGARSSV